VDTTLKSATCNLQQTASTAEVLVNNQLTQDHKWLEQCTI